MFELKKTHKDLRKKMEIEPLDDLMKKIMYNYDQTPEDWNVMSDLGGNVVILGPMNSYQLKLVQINPQKYTGVGMKIPEESPLQDLKLITQGMHSYGFRPLAQRNINQIIDSLQEGKMAQDQAIEDIFKTKPLPIREIERRRVDAVVAGPYLNLNFPNLGRIGSYHQEVERRLSIEADRIFRKKYPMRSSIYG